MLSRIIALTVMLSLAGACYPTVEIRTQPPGAIIEVTRVGVMPPDQPVRLSNSTPVLYKFDFAKSDEYQVSATKEGYQEATKVLSDEFTRRLPAEGRMRVLTIPLEKALYRDIEKAEVVVDPSEGLTIRVRTVRAFEEDIERQGVPASHLYWLGAGMWIGGLSVSPDGKHLVFSVVERAQDEKGRQVEFSNLRSVPTDGGGLAQITTGRWLDIDPSFSTDGAHLYFASNRLRTRHLDLFRIRSQTKDGGIAVVPTQSEGWSRFPTEAAASLLSFSFQPQYQDRAGTSQVWTLGGKNQFPTQFREGAHPRVSSSGQEIAYIGPDNKLWVLDLVVQNITQLTNNPDTVESYPSWSHDGEHLLYVSNEGRDNTGKANNDIWIMRRNGTDRRQLTTNGSDDTLPVAGPLGEWIYFVSNRGYKWGIWRIPWPFGQGK